MKGRGRVAATGGILHMWAACTSSATRSSSRRCRTISRACFRPGRSSSPRGMVPSDRTRKKRKSCSRMTCMLPHLTSAQPPKSPWPGDQTEAQHRGGHPVTLTSAVAWKNTEAEPKQRGRHRPGHGNAWLTDSAHGSRGRCAYQHWLKPNMLGHTRAHQAPRIRKHAPLCSVTYTDGCKMNSIQCSWVLTWQESTPRCKTSACMRLQWCDMPATPLGACDMHGPAIITNHKDLGRCMAEHQMIVPAFATRNGVTQ